MSKLLIKILSICALVVLLPLVVVGASLSVTEAVGCSLTVACAGDEGGSATRELENRPSSNVVIKVDGKVQEGTTIKVAKYSEVTVTYSGEGYNFKGWYEGEYYENIQTEKQPKKKLAEYTFELTHDTTLTAVRDIKKYTVHYQGVYDDGTTPIDLPDETVEYGQSLAIPGEAKAGGTWAGWKEVNANNEEVGEPVKVAKFTSLDVNLTAKWNDVMFVRFMDGNTEMFIDSVAKTAIGEYELPTLEDPRVKVPDGYNFLGWTLGGDPVESIEFDPNGYTLYLNKQLREYNITVMDDGQEFNTNGVKITFDVEHKFSNLEEVIKKQGYEVDSYTYKGVEYKSLENLGKEIAKSSDTNIVLTVKWVLSEVTLRVKFNVNDTTATEDLPTITYKRVKENGSYKETYTSYNKTRDGYRFVGLKYNGVVYRFEDGKYGSLGEELLADIQRGASNPVEVAAVWESEYGICNIAVRAAYNNGETNALVDGQLPNLQEDGKLVEFADEASEHGVDERRDLQDSIFSKTLAGHDITTQVTDGGEELFDPVSVRVILNSDYDIEYTTDEFELSDLTYFTVLADLEAKYPDEFADIQDIVIYFIYE